MRRDRLNRLYSLLASLVLMTVGTTIAFLAILGYLDHMAWIPVLVGLFVVHFFLVASR